MIEKGQTPEAPERVILGTSEISFEDPALVVYKDFEGHTWTIDLRVYRFKSAREAGEFVMKLATRSIMDSIILSGLRPERERG